MRKNKRYIFALLLLLGLVVFRLGFYVPLNGINQGMVTLV